MRRAHSQDSSVLEETKEGELPTRLTGIHMSRPTEPSVVSADEELEEDSSASGRVGMVVGLKSRADLNGQYGTAVRWVAKKQRWGVVMIDSGEKLLLRSECINFACAIDQAYFQAGVSSGDASIPAAATAAPSTAAAAAPVLSSTVPLHAKALSPAQTSDTKPLLDDEAASQASTVVARAAPPHPFVEAIFQPVRCLCLPFGATVGIPTQ
jgi:hypothetical protein